MKIAKTLLYILIIINSHLHANDNTFNVSSNLASSIALEEGVKWSLNGGIFMDAKDGIVINQSGRHEILLISPTGEIKTLEVNLTGGGSENLNILNFVYIDDKPPVLNYSWKNINKKEGKVVVGPNSQLFWESDDPNAVYQIFVNDRLLNTSKPPLQIYKNTSSIKINTIDVFGNESKNTVPFISKFTPPEVEWKLARPGLFESNKWYSKKKAKLIVTPQPGLAYKIDGTSFDVTNKATKIGNNSLLTATDELGNINSQTINWVIDKEPPSFLYRSLGKIQKDIKKTNLKTNQDIHISSYDKGVGLESAFFFSKKRRWEPLPKTFVFLSPGNYKINVKSKDKLGNNVKRKIKVRVKQDKRGWK